MRCQLRLPPWTAAGAPFNGGGEADFMGPLSLLFHFPRGGVFSGFGSLKPGFMRREKETRSGHPRTKMKREN